KLTSKLSKVQKSKALFWLNLFTIDQI
ncbi:unnamed protein product, partial [Oikopleura dioica]